MKVLLINPSFNLKKFGSFQRFMEPMPCIGLAYIAAVLEKNNIDVEIIDDFTSRLGEYGILNIIKEKKVDVVGISCLTPSAPGVFSLVKKIKEYNNNILTVLGNIHASIFSEDILSANEAVDIIVHGEGEYTMLEIVKVWEGNMDFANIDDISFKRDSQIIRTKPRAPLEDLDELPYPSWHLLPFRKYGLLPFADIDKPVLSISGSRGCPYGCIFCSLLHVSKKYRKRKAEKIVNEIDYLVNNFGVKQLGFVDPIFSLFKEDGLEFCEKMIKRGLNKKVIWICETRVDKVDKELLRAMAMAGCKRILYGIESGGQKEINNIKKNFSLDIAMQAIRNTKKEGIQSVGLFMLGLPGDTKESMRKTIRFAKEIDLDFAKFALTVPFPGSTLYQNLVSSGEFKRQDWENFLTFNSNSKDLVYIPGGLTAEELINMQQKAHFDFYLRPKIIFRHLFKIRTIRLKDLLLGFFSLILSYIKTKDK